MSLSTKFRSKLIKSVTHIGACALTVGLGLSAMSLPNTAEANDPFIAEITMFGGNFAPRGWAFCDGQLLAISSNTALFSLLGTTFGGDGRTTFGLPDLRGRAAIHPGQGPGLSNIRWGERGGSETATLSVNHLPSHTHTITSTLKGYNGAGDEAVPKDHSLSSKARTDIYSTSAPDVNMMSGSVESTASNTGGGQSFSIRNPYLGIYHIIALVGIFPSRS